MALARAVALAKECDDDALDTERKTVKAEDKQWQLDIQVNDAFVVDSRLTTGCGSGDG